MPANTAKLLGRLKDIGKGRARNINGSDSVVPKPSAN
jgi:hypothetical protein